MIELWYNQIALRPGCPKVVYHVLSMHRHHSAESPSPPMRDMRLFTGICFN